ncbi:MAG TPA: Hpt domain-containing protein [Pyrinomonadaceae bacterium]|nr:Hpt domain-containing protein [Pyrinomonadaceae bacterium]
MPKQNVSTVALASNVNVPQGMLSEFANLPVLDLKMIKNLEKEMTTRGLRNYLTFFLAGSPERLEEIAKVANAGDFEQLSFIAHDLVSTSGNIGALQMSCLARALARSCRARDSKAARLLLGELAIAALASNVEIRKWMGSKQP